MFDDLIGKAVVVTALARDWRSALDIALGRAARALVHAWRRSDGRGRVRTRTVAFER